MNCDGYDMCFVGFLYVDWIDSSFVIGISSILKVLSFSRRMRLSPGLIPLVSDIEEN